MRFAFLESDPPDNIERSSAIFCDEGMKALGARNVIFFNQTTQIEGDEYSGHVGNWFIFEIQKKLFQKYGVKLIVLRKFYAFLALLGTLMWFFMLSSKKTFNFKITFFILLMLHPMIIFFSRSALYEMPEIFLWILSMLPILISLKKLDNNQAHKAKFWFFLGIIALFIFLPLGLGIKRSYLLLFTMTIGAILLTHILSLQRTQKYFQKTKHRKKIHIATIISIASIYFVSWAIQPLSYMRRYVDNPIKMTTKFFTHDLFFLQPFVLLLTIFGIIAIIKKLTTSLKTKENISGQYTDFFMLTSFCGIFISTWFFSYNPPRYYLLSLLPQLYLATQGAIAIQRLNSNKIRNYINKKPLLSGLTITLFSFFTLAWASKIIFNYFTLKSVINTLTEFTKNNILISIPVLFSILITFYFIMRFIIIKFLPKITFTRLNIFLFIAYLSFFAHFILYRKNDFAQTKSFLASTLKKGDIVAGGWAPQLCFPLTVKAIKATFDNTGTNSTPVNIHNMSNYKPNYIIATSKKIAGYNKYLPKGQQLINGEEIYILTNKQHLIRIWKLDWSK